MKKKIKMASRYSVEALEPEIRRVLDAIGFSEAFVTDYSMIGDFDLDDNEKMEAAQTLGLEAINDGDYIVDIAAKLIR